MKWRVVLEQDPKTKDYSVWCPKLPGCTSVGRTRDEALGNIREAIALYLKPDPIDLSPGAEEWEVVWPRPSFVKEFEKNRQWDASKAYDKRIKDFARNHRKALTEAEKVLWGYLRKKQIGGLRFLRQAAIGYYIADFYCPKVRLIIEVDGGYHQEARQKMKDENRDFILSRRTYEVMRFSNEEVILDPVRVIKEINATAQKRLLAAIRRNGDSVGQRRVR